MKEHSMSMLFSRPAILIGWVAALLGLFVWAGWPMTLSTACLVLLVGIAPPVIALILSRESLTLSQRITAAREPRSGSRTS